MNLYVPLQSETDQPRLVPADVDRTSILKAFGETGHPAFGNVRDPPGLFSHGGLVVLKSIPWKGSEMAKRVPSGGMLSRSRIDAPEPRAL